MVTKTASSSSWIESIAYTRVPAGHSYLALFLKRQDRKDEPVALLYTGKDGQKVPSWLPGLLAAGTGKRSIGLAYNRLVKGNEAYVYQRIEGWEKVNQLKHMMGVTK